MSLLRCPRLLSGGKPGFTDEVTDGERARIVRRPPLGHLLATVHTTRAAP
ncbi:hypothetical protein [Streptomyces viridosporus]